MSRSKIFNMIKTRGTQTNARNNFDLGNAHAYTQKAGVITPIKAIHVIPDDFMHLNVGDFTQTFPMISAPFLHGKKEISAYFVSYNSLWHNYNQYQSTREDPQSAAMQVKGITYEPRISLYTLYIAAFRSFYYWLYYQFGIYAEQKHALPSVDELAIERAKKDFYNTRLNVTSANTCVVPLIGLFSNSSTDDPGVTTDFLRLASTDNQLTFDAFYTFSFANQAIKGDVFCNIVGNPSWCDIITKFDMLGYGNLWSLFKECLNAIETAFTEFDNSDFGDTAFASFGKSCRLNLRNLVNRLKSISSATPLVYVSATNVFQGTHSYVNLYPLFAYNRVFYDYFRNQYYDDYYEVRNYSLDFLSSNTLVGSICTLANLPFRFFNLEMHQYKKDMFTGIMPSTQFGAVSELQLSLPNIGGDLGTWHITNGQPSSSGYYNVTFNNSSHSVFEDNDGLKLSHHHVYDDGSGRALSNPSVNVNPLDLKRVEALQQFRQDLLRAGNRTEDIFKQIYGTEPKSQLSEKPYFIDAKSADIFVNPIISTAATGNEENGQLGDIASRGTINGANIDTKFSSNDFGCIIVLAYVVPETMYNSTRLDPHVCNLSPEEHFIPHFMNLGFEPLYRMFLSNLHDSDGRNSSVGFSLPYLEFKTDVDLAHGAFCEALSTTIDPHPTGTNPTRIIDFRGSLSQWVVLRSDMQSEETTSLRNFYINPSVLDTIFVQESGADYESDQFICYTKVTCDSVRQISELGLPNFL